LRVRFGVPVLCNQQMQAKKSRKLFEKRDKKAIYIYEDKGDFSVCAGRQIGAGYACASNHEHCCHAMMDAVRQVALQPRLLIPDARSSDPQFPGSSDPVAPCFRDARGPKTNRTIS